MWSLRNLLLWEGKGAGVWLVLGELEAPPQSPCPGQGPPTQVRTQGLRRDRED